ncbi:nucleotidyltransferase [Marinilongibacter aquaticus]|uniref:nucleotidyltransferase family protein n=1 Tax=Marinilongibacter aquaticus TaxID=2975157 RepID=UPI0021BD0249|nr:sugar phosphate nucleotidyltransferase [Marinilongibacter aquaticus]UBM59641.1 nucleotidyltransferase [Marinilongibacter aquaticus]
MTKPTLLILAAGMGSRYGGIKQIDQFGPNGETIIDYSLYDAIRAGFGKVVFIIREELKDDFEEIFAPKLEGKIEYTYAFQGYKSYVPEELGSVHRAKPWGTGHAMLCAWEHTQEPFTVINADDFYGAEAFQTMVDFLSKNTEENVHAMVGYQVKNTLSENGTVSRGVCQKDENGFLTSVIERTKIVRNEEGQIQFLDEGDPVNLDENTPVSMNFWAFMPSVFTHTKRYFEEYARKNFDSPKAEFYIPTVMSKMMDEGIGQCKVFDTTSDWFGVTYPEDKEKVQVAIRKLVDARKYPENLWE